MIKCRTIREHLKDKNREIAKKQRENSFGPTASAKIKKIGKHSKDGKVRKNRTRDKLGGKVVQPELEGERGSGAT